MDSAARPRWWRWMAYGFVGVGVLATVIEVYAHRNPRGYLALEPLAGLGVTVTVAMVVPVLLALAVLEAAPTGWVRTWSASALAALVLPVGGVGMIRAELADLDYRPVSVQTAAASSDGRWEVVGIRSSCSCNSDGGRMTLHLRSRAGWLSREAPRPLADIWTSYHGDGLEIERVELPAGTTIEIFTSDGAVHRTSFDPGSLAIADQFGHCADDWKRLCP